MTTKLFQEIETLVPTLDGWCSPQRACELAAIVVGLKPKTTVVLGTWGGRDLLSLAMAHRHNGFGRVVGCDPYSAQASVEGQTGKDSEWWSNQQMHDLVCERFLGNIKALGLTDWVEFHKAKSRDVTPPKDIGLLISDANHGPEAISEIETWAPNVVPSGIVYCDDIGWAGNSVKEAVSRLLKMGFVQLYERDTGAFFQRTK